jgi:hypothetical protein
MEKLQLKPMGELSAERNKKLSSVPDLRIHLKNRERAFFDRLKDVATVHQEAYRLSKGDIGYTMITREMGLFTGSMMCNIASKEMSDALSELVNEKEMKIQMKEFVVSDCFHLVLTATDIVANKTELIDPTYGQYKPFFYARRILFAPFENLESLYPVERHKEIDFKEVALTGRRSDIPENVLTAFLNLRQALL